jgi:hypothetical protein
VRLTSYDLRNFSPAWPILFTSGFAGWAELLPRLSRRAAPWTLPAPWPTAAGFALAGAMGAWLAGDRISKERLRALQDSQQMKLCGECLSSAIYRYADKPGIKGGIVTNLQLLRYLPGLSGWYVYDRLDDPHHFQEATRDPANRYVLVPSYAGIFFDAEIRRALDEQLRRGDFRLAFEVEGWQFLERVDQGAP